MRLSLFGPESLVFASLFLMFLKSSSSCRSIKQEKMNQVNIQPYLTSPFVNDAHAHLDLVKTKKSSPSLGVLGRFSLEWLKITFTFTFTLLLIISTHKLVVSRNFLSRRIVVSFFYLLVFYLRNCWKSTLRNWIRRLPFAVFVRLLNLSVRGFRLLRRKRESLSSFLTFFETRKLSSPFSRIIVARTD